ncbi:hypothetical protein [Luteolibacter sp. Populi]|uniref:hypothetical protein n=1 Tax=Luteolibacter sp. Populi TaxID=3230487 RepID=UPI003467B964
MPDPAERFIAAALNPFANNPELEMAARQMLEGTIAADGGEIPATAVGRLEAADRRGKSGRWRAALWIVALIAAGIAAVLGFLQWRHYYPQVQLLAAMGGSGPGSASTGPSPEELLARGLTPAQRLLLLGDLSRRSRAERWQALRDSDPQNADYYVDYVLAYRSEHDALPPNFLETGKRIDPGNAWFAAYAAGVLAEEAVEARPRTPAQVKAKEPKSYDVKDAAKLKEARDLFREAAHLPSFDLRQGELFRRRVELLPRRTSAFNHLPTVMYVAGMRAASLPVRHLTDLVGPECERLVAEKDSQGLRDLIADWDSFIAIYAPATDSTMIDALVKQVLLRSGYRDLGRAAETLELSADAARLQAVADRYDAYYEKRNAASEANAAAREELTREMSALAGLALPTVSKQVLNPPELRGRLAPGRLAEHEFALKCMTLFVLCPTLLICGLCLALYRFRGGELQRLLSARLVSLLTPKDWALILGGGVALPFIAYQVLARLPWTGCREWGIAPLKFLTPAVGVTLITWLMVVLPVVVARRRLEQRAGFLGLRWRFQWVAWLVCLVVALAIPVVGHALLPWKPNTALTMAVLIVILIPECWIIVAAFRGLFSRSGNLLKRLVLCRVLLPAQAIAVILGVLSLLLCHGLEKHWAQRDELTEITPEAPSLSRFEYEVTQIARREILDILALPD